MSVLRNIFFEEVLKRQTPWGGKAAVLFCFVFLNVNHFCEVVNKSLSLSE